MKKKLSIISVCIAVLLICMFSLGCTGARGKSAYEIAVQNGFSGTEQEWLDSLKGTDGTNGTDGRDGIDGIDGQDSTVDIYDVFEIYLETNPEATFNDFIASFLSIEYYDTEYAASMGILSVLRVRSKFQVRSGMSYTDAYSEGSGVLYLIEDSDAYIITNYHVVYEYTSLTKTAEEITLSFFNASESISAQLVGGSISNDIAVLKASSSELPSYMIPATVADSNSLRAGASAVAVGNPLAEGIAVTSGIISVDSEQIEMDALNSSSGTVFIRVIRVDTPINSGNSGGGLFNSRGELIGIINAKTVSSGVEGMGYAIPSNTAKGIADCVIENEGKKCVLGITVTAKSTSAHYIAKNNAVEIIESLVITEITSGAIADGHFQVGDKLISASINDSNKIDLTRIFYLSDYLFSVRNGDILTIDILRNGEQETITLTADSSRFNAL